MVISLCPLSPEKRPRHEVFICIYSHDTESKPLSSELEKISSVIHTIRGQKVILDVDLAVLYGVTTKALNQAVKRNRERFPEQFVFRLTKSEAEILRSQFVTLEEGGHFRYLPYAFTEHGALMAANVLHSK